MKDILASVQWKLTIFVSIILLQVSIKLFREPVSLKLLETTRKLLFYQPSFWDLAYSNLAKKLLVVLKLDSIELDIELLILDLIVCTLSIVVSGLSCNKLVRKLFRGSN